MDIYATSDARSEHEIAFTELRSYYLMIEIKPKGLKSEE